MTHEEQRILKRSYNVYVKPHIREKHNLCFKLFPASWFTLEGYYQDVGIPPSTSVAPRRMDEDKPFSRENFYWGSPTHGEELIPISCQVQIQKLSSDALSILGDS